MSSITYPKRKVECLNGVWDFSFSESHDWNDENLSLITYDDRLPVPSAFDAMPGYNGKRGVGFYRHAIEIPAGSKSRINFNAAGMYAKVFIDGKKVGEQYAAYTPFTVAVPVSDKTERELVVMCGNRFDYDIYPLHEIFFDFYAYGGIFRDVELQVLPEGSLIEWVGVDTVDYRTGDILVKIRGLNNGDNFTVAIDNQKPQEFTASESPTEIPLKITDFTPWSPATPELHTVTIDNGVDAQTVRFGIRQVKAEKGQILLNGKPVKLLGYCRHEAHPQYGPALPYAQLIADLQILRDIGCNFIRGSHYQQDPRFLDLCDELGFLVFEESMGWGQQVRHFTDPKFIDAQLAQTATMIQTSYNHPSVIMRGFLNEGESDNEESRKCYEALINLVRKKDPTRLVTYASFKHLKDLFLDQVDVICFNTYPAWYTDRNIENPLDEIVPCVHNFIDGLETLELGDKPFILSEIGAGAIYGWRDPICSHWSEEYQTEYLKITCNEVVNNNKIAGVALWQFCDCRTYRGAGALGRPRAFNNKGTLDEYRRPKMAYNTVKEIFKGYNEK